MFRKHTFVLTRAQLSLSWLQSQKCRHAVVMCFWFGAMQHYVDNLLLLALNLRVRLATIYTLCTYTWCFSIWWLPATWLMVFLRNTSIHRYTRALHKSCFLFTFLSLVVMRRMLIVLLALASNTMCQVFSSWEREKIFS